MEHRHYVNIEGEPRAFTGAIHGAEENRNAHGGIEVDQTCGCGYVRHVNVNHLHEEVGHWYDPGD